MTRFAPVMPIHLVEAFNTYKQLGNYHLLLAHDIIKDDESKERYGQIFHNHDRSMTVILDNSVVELGTAANIDVIAEAAQVVSADVIVLPDVYMAQQATIASCTEAAETWTYPLDKVLGAGNWSYMYAPQGNNLAAFIYCAQFLLDSPNIGWWGIPRNLVEQFGSRQDAVKLCRQLNYRRQVHLLGFSDNMMDDVLSSTILGVTGIDSAVPIRAASVGIPFQMIYAESNTLPKRGDWWDNAEQNVFKPAMITNVVKARELFRDPREFDNSYAVAPTINMDNTDVTIAGKISAAGTTLRRPRGL